jgi:hypothetical protein
MTNPMDGTFISSMVPHRRPVPAILVGGLIVGVLDLIYAVAVYSPEKPILIPQFIASGVLGMAAFSGGLQTAMLGVVLHFAIAFGAAAVYYLASRKFTILVRQAYLCGLLFGVFVYTFMHVVVVPLSATPKGPTHLVYQAFELIEHCFCVGLPIALSVRRYAR